MTTPRTLLEALIQKLRRPDGRDIAFHPLYPSVPEAAERKPALGSCWPCWRRQLSSGGMPCSSNWSSLELLTFLAWLFLEGTHAVHCTA